MDDKRSQKLDEARNSLPVECQPTFDDLVNDYKFFATKHYRSPFVSYMVLAELVKAGWRLAAAPIAERDKSQDQDAARNHGGA